MLFTLVKDLVGVYSPVALAPSRYLQPGLCHPHLIGGVPLSEAKPRRSRPLHDGAAVEGRFLLQGNPSKQGTQQGGASRGCEWDDVRENKMCAQY